MEGKPAQVKAETGRATKITLDHTAIRFLITLDHTAIRLLYGELDQASQILIKDSLVARALRTHVKGIIDKDAVPSLDRQIQDIAAEIIGEYRNGDFKMSPLFIDEIEKAVSVAAHNISKSRIEEVLTEEKIKKMVDRQVERVYEARMRGLEYQARVFFSRASNSLNTIIREGWKKKITGFVSRLMDSVIETVPNPPVIELIRSNLPESTLKELMESDEAHQTGMTREVDDLMTQNAALHKKIEDLTTKLEAAGVKDA